MTTTPKPLVLIILDGFGHSESHHDNAVYSANKPVLDRLTIPEPLITQRIRSIGQDRKNRCRALT